MDHSVVALLEAAWVGWAREAFTTLGPTFGASLATAWGGVLVRLARTDLRPLSRRGIGPTIRATTWMALGATLLTHVLPFITGTTWPVAVSATIGSAISGSGAVLSRPSGEAYTEGRTNGLWDALSFGIAYANRWLTERLQQQMLDTVDGWRRFGWRHDDDIVALHADLRAWVTAGRSAEVLAELELLYRSYRDAYRRWSVATGEDERKVLHRNLVHALGELLRWAYRARCDSVIRMHMRSKQPNDPAT
jgi:hypothetical protein